MSKYSEEVYRPTHQPVRSLSGSFKGKEEAGETARQ